MGLSTLFRREAAPDSDELKCIDSWLLKLHQGRLPADEHEGLRRLAVTLGLTDEQLAARQAAVVRRKAAEVAERDARRNPQLAGDAVAVEPTEVTVYHLRYSGDDHAGGVGVIEDHLRADNPLKLPHPQLTRWDRAPTDDREEFRYLVAVLKDLYAGRITPGKVGVIRRDGERFEFGPVGGNLPLFVAERPPESFVEFEQWYWLRMPNQSERQQREALELFVGNLKKKAGGYAPPPRGVPAFA